MKPHSVHAIFTISKYNQMKIILFGIQRRKVTRISIHTIIRIGVFVNRIQFPKCSENACKYSIYILIRHMATIQFNSNSSSNGKYKTYTSTIFKIYPSYMRRQMRIRFIVICSYNIFPKFNF